MSTEETEETCIGCLRFIGFLLLIGLHIAEITVSTINYNTTTCSNADIILPVKWLLIGGIIGLASILFIISISIKLCIFGNESFPGLLVTLFNILLSFFLIIWAIIGGIMLYRYNQDCKPTSLRAMLAISAVERIFGGMHIIINMCERALKD